MSSSRTYPVDLGLFLVVGGRWQQQFAAECRLLLLLVVVVMMMMMC